jgi:hypothetical protein
MEVPMADSPAKRDRSPSFPSIALKDAIDRLVAFEKYFGRHTAPVDKAGAAWNLKTADQTIAALRYFGLIDYVGRPGDRQVAISEDGRNYLRAQQASVKQEILKRAAVRPKEIRKFWEIWGADRPPDLVCADDLVLKNGFSQRGASIFLKVYDATIAFAGLGESDKVVPDREEELSDAETDGDNDDKPDPPPPPPPRVQGKAQLMEGERVVFTEESDPEQYIKVIASGEVDDSLLDALSDYVKRQRKRLADSQKAVTRQHAAFAGPDEGHLASTPGLSSSVTDWETGGR